MSLADWTELVDDATGHRIADGPGATGGLYPGQPFSVRDVEDVHGERVRRATVMSTSVEVELGPPVHGVRAIRKLTYVVRLKFEEVSDARS